VAAVPVRFLTFTTGRRNPTSTLAPTGHCLAVIGGTVNSYRLSVDVIDLSKCDQVKIEIGIAIEIETT
jgi:hypothetical protein